MTESRFDEIMVSIFTPHFVCASFGSMKCEANHRALGCELRQKLHLT
jgi:hypothetical protein